MVTIYPSEQFRQIPIDAPLRLKYALSNYGRLISYSETFQDGRELKGGTSDGYRTLNYKYKKDGVLRNKHIFLYKVVANLFLPPATEDQIYVLHLDHSRDNDKISNLQRATRAEMLEHTKKSPRVIESKKYSRLGKGKLNSTQVIHIKKRLLDPNRKTRVRILAKQFGVSEMQLHRIRTGENWSHIVVDVPKAKTAE